MKSCEINNVFVLRNTVSHEQSLGCTGSYGEEARLCKRTRNHTVAQIGCPKQSDRIGSFHLVIGNLSLVQIIDSEHEIRHGFSTRKKLASKHIQKDNGGPPQDMDGHLSINSVGPLSKQSVLWMNFRLRTYIRRFPESVASV